MAQSAIAVQNNFTKGLKTEFSGLNFPEDSCTSTNNCVFLRTGSVIRRSGFDYEANYTLANIDRIEKAISTYRWLNAGGDGETQLLVVQVGSILSFYESSSATAGSPLSSTKLSTSIDISQFSVGGAAPDAIECQYADGNGYLFVYHPNIDPIYITFNSGTPTANRINVQIRDFVGDVEVGVPDTLRPGTLDIAHDYNLKNQGWTEGPTWSTTSSTPQAYYFVPVVWTFYGIAPNASIMVGDQVQLKPTGGTIITNTLDSFPQVETFTGIVVNYNSGGGSLTINITSALPVNAATNTVYIYWFSTGFMWNIFTASQGQKITTWHTEIGNYPSNADVWWQFKDTTQLFNPAITIGNVTLNSGPAPKGYYILDAFNQDRTLASGVTGINPVTTTKRPKTGCWFQGRVWYTGVDASVTQNDIIPDANNTANKIFYSWSESIYFSQIITNTSQFGKCHQTNDPTSEDLFDLLPTDGGVIQIQGCGSIFKLFPVQNGLLVFAANGIWYITGSSGVGFSANDYTITKISGVESLSSTSFVDVQGLPIFWNEEDIYSVSPRAQDNRNNEQLGLAVQPLTLTTIKTFYKNIPTSSKRYARGYYNPITNVLQWVYRSTEETDVTSRYEFDSVLNLNTLTSAFYPWTITSTKSTPHVHGVTYIISPGGSGAPDPVFKYLTSNLDTKLGYQFTFSEERDLTNYVDWQTTVPTNYVSAFTTGYALHGQAMNKWQPEYVYVYQNLTPPIVKAASGPPQFLVWDNSGDVYLSKNLGATWTVNQTPNSSDTWNDVVMATNAGDWSTMVGFDNGANPGDSTATAFSSQTGLTGSWSIGLPNIANASTFGYSGAVSANGKKIIALPSSFLGGHTAQSFPQISTDKGATWTPLTVPSGRWWNVACMDSTATNIYMVWILPDGSNGGISKSSDGGVTWTDLPDCTDPPDPTPIPIVAFYDSFCAQRIRCSSDGQTFIHVTTTTNSSGLFGAGFTFVSTDGGATIKYIDPSHLPGSHFTDRTCSDCGVSDDGKIMLLGMGSVFSFRCYLALSKDSGATWTQLTPPNFLNDPTNHGHALQTCALSPDGQSIIAVYQDTDGVDNFSVDISTDQGVTWTSSTIVQNTPGSTPVTTYIIQP